MSAPEMDPVAAVLAGVGELGATVDVATAARLLGIGRTTAYQLASQDALPVPVVRIGRTLRVPTVPLLTLLGITAPGPVGGPSPAQGPVWGGAERRMVARDEGSS